MLGIREKWRSAGRRRLVRGAAYCVLAGVIMAVAWPHAALVALLSFFASEAYPDGVRQGLRLPWDSMQTLAEYPPKQLAWYLNAPSPRWRATAVSTLWYQVTEEIPGDFAGVATRLAATALADPNPAIRHLAADTLLTMKSLDPAEAEPILHLIAQHPETDRSDRLIWFVAERAPESRESVHELAMGLGQSGRLEGRLLALRVFAQWFPRSEGLAPLFDRLRESIGPDSRALAYAFGELARVRPDLIATLLDGEVDEQCLALSALSRAFSRPNSSMPSDPSGMEPPILPPVRGQADPAGRDALLQKGAQTAAAFLRAPDARQQRAALGFLRDHPAGGVILLRALKDLPKERHRRILMAVSNRSVPGRDGLRFGIPETEVLLDCSIAADRDVAGVAYGILARALWSQDHPFDPGAAPTAERWGPFLTKALQDHPDRSGALLALECFCRGGTIDPALIPAAERVVREQPFAGAFAFRYLVEHHPDHPRVRALAWDALGEDRLAGLAKDGANLLLRSEPDPAPAYDRLLKSYFAAPAQRRSQYLWAVAQWWPRLGPKGDAKTAKMLLEDCFKMYWPDPPHASGPPFVPPSWGIDRATLEAVAAAFDPQLVQEQLVARIEQILGQDRRNAIGPVGDINLVMRLFGDLQAFPKAMEKVAADLLSSNDSTARVHGLRLVIEAGARSPAFERTVAALLEDESYVVQINAVDAAGTLGLRDPALLDRLEAMTSADQPEMLRAAALRNLAILDPEAPRTQDLANAFLEDPRRVVRTEAERILRGERKPAVR